MYKVTNNRTIPLSELEERSDEFERARATLSNGDGMMESDREYLIEQYGFEYFD